MILGFDEATLTSESLGIFCLCNNLALVQKISLSKVSAQELADYLGFNASIDFASIPDYNEYSCMLVGGCKHGLDEFILAAQNNNAFLSKYAKKIDELEQHVRGHELSLAAKAIKRMSLWK